MKMANMVVGVLLSTLAGGCATQSEQARTEGGLWGGAITGLLAGGACALAGGNAGTCAAIGVAGAAVGAYAGVSYADQVDKRRQELAGKENDVNARIAFAQGVSQDTQSYNQNLSQNIAASEQDITGLQARIKSGEANQQELRDKRSALIAQKGDADKQLTVAERQLADLKQFQSGRQAPSPPLDREIAALEEQVEQLQGNTKKLAELSQPL